MKMVHLSEKEREKVGKRLAHLIRRGVKKCDVARELDMPWQLIHAVAARKRLPHPLTCLVLTPWLDAKEKELGV